MRNRRSGERLPPGKQERKQERRPRSQPGAKTDGHRGHRANSGHTEKMPPFSQSLPMLLMRSREAVMRYFRPSLRAHGVTEQQWRVLRAISYAGATEITELARLTFLHAPSLSRILRDLLRRGLIERTAGATDRRRSVVSISKRGASLIQAVTPDSDAGYTRITERFGAQRLKALRQMLQDLEVALLSGLPATGPEASQEESV